MVLSGSASSLDPPGAGAQRVPAVTAPPTGCAPRRAGPDAYGDHPQSGPPGRLVCQGAGVHPPPAATPDSPSGRFSAAELDAAFAGFQATVADVAATGDWDRFAEMFTDDALYLEHALGTMHGREEIRSWIWRTMTAFPGSHMVAFPSLWHVADPATGRVICEVDNPMRDPGDGSAITATNITILTYAGGGRWSREEDVYNPLEFGAAAMTWCERARDLGTLDDPAAEWMRTTGRAFGRRG